METMAQAAGWCLGSLAAWPPCRSLHRDDDGHQQAMYNVWELIVLHNCYSRKTLVLLFRSLEQGHSQFLRASRAQ